MGIFDKKEEKEESRDDLKAKIKALEAKIAAGEDAALNRICKAYDIDPSSLNNQKANEDIIACFVPHQVNINGRKYLGKVEVPRSVFDMLQQAIGAKRMRHIRELTGNTTILESVIGGGFVPKIVKTVGIDGQEVSHG